MSYRIVLVEDEVHQQEMMKSLLALHPDFLLEGVASSIEEGKKLLESVKPDLALLDVMVSSRTTFEMLNEMKEIPFDIIFTTSYDHFAVQAFRLAAVDYLMKPVDKSELDAALEKFRQRKDDQSTSANIKNLLANVQLPPSDGKNKIALPTLTGYMYMVVKDIVRCQADNTYTVFHTTDRHKVVISRSMKEIEQLLIGYRFFRVHQSHLINLDCIAEYIKGEGGTIIMTDGSEIEVSRRRKDEFLHLMRSK